MPIRFRFWRVVLAPVVPLAGWWARRVAEAMRAGGRPLTEEESEMARRLGVQDPAAVRVVVTRRLPWPGPCWLHRLVSRLGFPATEAVGLCLGQTIFLHPEYDRPEMLAHELVHTAQCDRLGGLRPFLHRYLAECLTHGYAAAPMEHEARSLA